MALALYDRAVFFANGAMFAEARKVTVKHENNAQDIITMQKGLAGFSPGYGRVTMTVDNAVPQTGLEFDYISSLQNLDIIEVTLFRAAKKITCKGVIKNVDENYDAESPSAVSFDFTGTPVDQTTI